MNKLKNNLYMLDYNIKISWISSLFFFKFHQLLIFLKKNYKKKKVGEIL